MRIGKGWNKYLALIELALLCLIACFPACPTPTEEASPTPTYTSIPPTHTPTPTSTPQPKPTPTSASALAPIPVPEIVPEPITSPLFERPKGRTKEVYIPPQTLRALHELTYEQLIRDVKTNEFIGIRQIVYSLPNKLAEDEHLILLLGQHLPTRFGERLPEGVIAIVSQFPEGVIGVIGPFVWVNDNSVSRLLYDTDMIDVYKSQGYPEVLFAEIYIQAPFEDRWMPFRPTDRVGDFVGEELASGAIKWGAPYLYVDEDGSWQLREYPDIPPKGDAVNLMWNFNPINPETGHREFGVPIYLRQQQFLQQSITLKNPQDPQDNVGPSIIFRTDKRTGQTDITAIVPYLYLSNFELFRDIIFKTPLADESLPKPNELIVAAGDMHYTSNGRIGPLLDSDEVPLIISVGEAREDSVDINGVRNHTGFYLGIPIPEATPEGK
jgi:hypothetical protein